MIKKNINETSGISCHPWGCMIYLTSRCQHRCVHCFETFTYGNEPDMPDDRLDEVIVKCAESGLLGNVTLIGGEPFIDPQRLLDTIRKIWMAGQVTWEIFIPTNGRWVCRDDWEDIVRELVSLGQWFPYDLRVAFSKNEWNLEQLGELAPLVLERWQSLEERHPSVFYHRTLVKEELLPLGRAADNQLSAPASHVGVNCNFDDWYDAASGGGYCTDYLSFYPDGSCGMCYVYHSPIIGRVEDDFSQLLEKRRRYLTTLREHITGDPFGILPPDVCVECKRFYPLWDAEQVK